jgi:uncharacterized protein YjbI with pentapeptide repeats
MGAKLRSWWQKIRSPLLVVGVVAASVLVITLTVVLVLGYKFNWDWTGLGPYTPPSKISNFQRGKTLWDWMQLLIIPLVLAVAALLFNLATTRTGQKIAAQRYEQDQHIALDKQRDDLLQAYFDRMSELLLKEKLRSSAVDAEVRKVARVRTLAMLHQLDTRRANYVLSFLRELGLIASDDARTSIITFSKANLRNVDLHEDNFHKIDLHKIDLSGADFREVNLCGAILSEANLNKAILINANLRDAHLKEANLSGANLSGAILKDANLRNTNLSGVDFYQTDLSRANLSGANVTEEQLKTAKSLEGATMPDGSIHP